MITNPQALDDTVVVAETLKKTMDLPLSILISPTLIKNQDLMHLKEAGADMIGVAIDAATKQLFEQYRGNGVKGPHRWEHYWNTLIEAVGIFGQRKVGAHLIVGLGETEQEMTRTFQRVHDMGSLIHLFSFFAEPHSQLQELVSPTWDSYLRLQLARYLIEEGLSQEERFTYDENHRIIDFGQSEGDLREIVNTGFPFLTSGCPDSDGKVACNRPFGNCLPGPQQWNYPYPPNQEELNLISRELGL
jgi:biotin synthase